jgi:hypothetical protein
LYATAVWMQGMAAVTRNLFLRERRICEFEKLIS